MFRSASEATFSVESTGNETSNAYHVGPEKSRSTDQRVNQPKDGKALAPKIRPFAHGPSAPMANYPELHPTQRLIVFHLALLEGKCKSTAARMLNKPRESSNHLAEDHPDVKSLARKLYAPLAKEWIEKAGLPEDFISEKGAAFRDAMNEGFEDALNTAAEKELRGLEPSSSPKGRESTVVRFGPLQRGGPLSPPDESGSAPSLMLGANRTPFKLESPYRDEYLEISTLGKGGYGQVFRVRNHLDKQEYAIKKIVITSQRIRRYLKEDQVDALLSEVQTLAKLSHTNIVRYYHAWVEYKPSVLPSTSTAAVEEQSDDSRMLPEPLTQETAEDYEVSESSAGLKYLGLDQHELDDNIVFGFSSTHQSQDPHNNSARIQRASHITKSSNLAMQTSILSVGEEDDDDDDEIENIPRATEEIGLSLSRADVSIIQAAANQAERHDLFGPDITLFIKMSLHPMTLSTFLSMDTVKDSIIADIRHCFHQEPSVDILSCILDGLDYLHSQRIVHRDIKPANIFLSINENAAPSLKGCVNIMGCSQCSQSNETREVYVTPCIGDFGLIAEMKEPVASKESEAGCSGIFEPSRLSVLHQKPVGTLFYRPVSMPNKEPIICPKLDVYSLGVIALEMIHKFSTKSERAIILTNLKRGVLPPELKDHSMASGIQSMTCEDRDARWDCDAVRNWLEKLKGKGKGLE